MDELLEQFVIEGTELVQQAAEDLLALEREPASRSHIESLFRAVHTLKGSVGLFDFAPLQSTLFAAEDVLTRANKAGEIDEAAVDPLIAIVEWTDRCVREIAAGGTLPTDAPHDAARLTAALVSPEPGVPVAPERVEMPDWAAEVFSHYDAATVAIRYVPLPDSFFSGDDPIALLSVVPGLIGLRITTLTPWPPGIELDPFRSNLSFVAAATADRSELNKLFRLLPDQVTLVSRLPAQVSAPAPAPQREMLERRTMRVDVDRVDALVDLVGELFIAKNSLSPLAYRARQIDGGLALARDIATVQEELDRLSTRLQRATTEIRMVPLNDTLRRLPRIVREVAAQLGKLVDVEIDGGTVAADKSVVDALFDPLLHVLRNAIDHGIEPTAMRLSRGKQERGRISVRARQSGYRVEVIVADDGGGVDIEAVRAAAIHKGAVTADEAAMLDDAGVIELLFRSGFSTAETVTDVSGRGVGMDAVRREVQRLGGRVSLASESGQGTTVTLSLPTNFAVSRIMIIDAAGDRYAVPMDVIAETLRIRSDAISAVRSGEAFVLRDRTVPVVRLARLLGLPTDKRDEELLLVADLGGGYVGVVIDAIGDRLDTILRPATGLLKTVNGISGTTVLGDGSVVMVLDLEALIQ